MNRFFKRDDVIASLRGGARTAKYGTPEQKSGRFLPPRGWKGTTVGVDDKASSDTAPRRGKRAA